MQTTAHISDCNRTIYSFEQQNGTPMTLKSPGFPFLIPKGLFCYWVFFASTGRNINFQTITLRRNDSHCIDFIQLIKVKYCLKKF